MSTLIPFGPVPWVTTQFCDDDGVPLNGGFVYFYAAGTVTPQDTYADANGDATNTNPVVLDSAGRAPIYIQPLGYRVIVKDADGNTILDRDDISDLAQLYLDILATASITAAVTSGYTVLSTDRWLTVNSTSGPNPGLINLPAAADRSVPITIKVIGDTPIQLVPQTGETIDGETGNHDMPAAASPNFPTIVLCSDGVSGWWIQASHGL